MRKMYFVLGLVLLLCSGFLVLLFSLKDDSIEEVAYSIRASHSYLSDGNVDFNIKLYTNNKDSLLAYPKEALITLEDKNKDNVVEVKVNSSRLDQKINYEDNVLYQYTYGLRVDINSLYIKNCFLRVAFSNQTYLFNIGDFEIVENCYDKPIFNITNLYGLTSDTNNKSLSAIVMTIRNQSSKSISIKEIKIGSNYQTNLGLSKDTTIKESNDIADYLANYDKNANVVSGQIILEKDEVKTIVIPIKYLKDLYLYNCFLLFNVDGKLYYFNNFYFIESNDLNIMNKYIEMAKIYDT